jgi:transposase-like protein
MCSLPLHSPGRLIVPTRSKFTAATRDIVLSSLRFGVSRETAAHIAGIDPTTLGRWIERGRTGAEGRLFKEFRDGVMRAEAEPRLKLAAAAYRAALDDPVLAWKIAQRIEPAFRPEQPGQQFTGPMVVTLTLDPPNRPLPHRPLSVIDRSAP